MIRYKLTFEYDGAEFSGWQKQPDARTVEGVVEKAFSTLFRCDVDVVGQGRTDAGVHAEGQTAHADLPETFTPSRILRAMKGLLPADVALLSAEPVHSDFHARFDAISRRYRYTITTRPAPLKRAYCWRVHKPLNVELLQQCAELIKGEHDFINFCKPPEGEYQTTICDITESCWVQHNDELVYRIEGNRFLRHLVRRLAGSMVQVGDKTLAPAVFKRMILGKAIEKKGHTGPPNGLVLERVRYF